MTPALTWRDLPGRSIGVWGAGVEGRATLRRLRADGIEPVMVDASAGALDDGTEVLGMEEGGREALLRCDLVVKSPGISRYSPEVEGLESAGVVVAGGLGLWLAGTDSARVLCITGTKGKSTTTSIAGALLRGLGVDHRLGGNIGVPPWDPDLPGDPQWWVIETSSYQALDVVHGPRVVAVTSLSEDHVPWHGGRAKNYFRDKLSLCTRPGVEVVVADGTSELLRAHAPLLGPDVQWVQDEAGHWADHEALLGAHNRRNAELARRALLALGVPGVEDESLLGEAFRSFVPLPSRLTPVAERDGVLFVDDSISTNVLSAVAAVRSFPHRRIALLLGGLGRDIDYRPLAACLRGADVRVFTMPSNGPLIGRTLRDEGFQAVYDSASLERAVCDGFEWARPGGIVLLSPAAASFDLFRDYRARGQAFADAASNCS